MGNLWRPIVKDLPFRRGAGGARWAPSAALWPESLPPSWTVALSAIISRLRSRLATLGLVRSHIIGNAFGCYQFSAPADTWVDVEAAFAGVDAAEGFVAAGNPQAAYGR